MTDDAAADSTLRVAMAPSTFASYSRNVMLRRALCSAGVDVVALETSGGTVWAEWRSLWRAARAQRFDVLLLTYPAHRFVPVAWLVARVRRAPVVVDPLFSLHETKIVDRREASRWSARAVAARAADVAACRLATTVLVDSSEHAALLGRVSRSRPERFVRVWTGTDEAIMRRCETRPEASPLHPGAGWFHAVHYGNYFPLQGVDVILDAAELLRAEPIVITMIGEGPTRPPAEHRARTMGLDNVHFVDRVGYPALHAHLCSANAVLGIFSTSSKASRVVPNKVYDALAVGRPVITGDTPAARELLTDGRDALLAIPGDGAALASAIRRLAGDRALGERLAGNGEYLFRERASATAQAPLVAGTLRSATASGGRWRRRGAASRATH